MDDPRIDALAREICPWIDALCSTDRNVGTPGNAAANALFADVAEATGFTVDRIAFDCVTWQHGPSILTVGGASWDIAPGPYSLGALAEAPLVVVRTLDELRRSEARGAILLALEPLTAEQLTPVGYPFYVNEAHAEISATLLEIGPAAILAATDRDPGMAGGACPFPWIEDGAFDIPSAYVHARVGAEIAAHVGERARITIDSRRIPARAEQLTATKLGAEPASRTLVTAHIDAKYGTPGALDNASGVATLMALARLLAEATPTTTVQLVPFNGEDHWAAPGELAWLERDAASDTAPIELVMNVDGAGRVGQAVAISTYGLDERTSDRVTATLEASPGMVAGNPWYQSDHMIFAMRGTPAIAATTADASELFGISHTDRDVPEIVDPTAIAQLAAMLARLLVD